MQFSGTPGLILPGGGARAAYQVGVLKAIAAVLDSERLPFPAVAGISAGAINAAKLAQHADDFIGGTLALERIWGSMQTADIFLMDYGALQKFLSKSTKPLSLLDNAPLRTLLEREHDAEATQRMIEQRYLRGLAVTASNYTTGEATTFFQAHSDVLDWHGYRRDSVRTTVGVGHLMASAALPVLFPPERVGDAFYLDGSLRMTEPLSPAIKLGADRILVIGVRQEAPDVMLPEQPAPGIAEVSGYVLDSFFSENLNSDMQRMHQVNTLLAEIPFWRRRSTGRRPIKVMVIRPSQDLRQLAARHSITLPRGIRLFLRTVGGWGHEWRLPSYLLFEAGYTQALMDLGYRDGLKARPQLEAFFS